MRSELAKSLLMASDLLIQPVEQAETLPSAYYTEPDYLKIESEAMFSKEWQLACHESQIPNAGDSICRTVAENPVIIVRTNEMEVKAFYNVCKHRGGPMSVKKGTTSVLQCQYHGWTYLMDGSLRGVPQFDRVELFDKKDYGLRPVQSAIWDGLVFITLSENPRPINRVVRGISDRINPIQLSEMEYYTSTVDVINCNWKVYVDNYLEGYHIPIVHPELATLLDYKNYVTETDEFYSLQYSPFSSTSADNPYNVEDGRAYYYFIYPNIMLNILPGRLQTNIIEPAGHDQCRVIFDFFYSDRRKAEDTGTISGDLKASAEIQREDIDICEAVQRGLRSKAYDKGRFSVKRELGVWHFQKLVKQSFSAYLKHVKNITT
jgi:choline monooxygenase